MTEINLYEIPLARSGRRSTCLYHVGSSKRSELLVRSSSCLLPKIHLLTSISMLISPELDATLIQQSKNICFNSVAISARKSCPFSLLLHYLLLPKKVSFSKSMLSGAKGKTSESQQWHLCQASKPSLCSGGPPDCLVGGEQGGWAIKGDKVEQGSLLLIFCIFAMEHNHLSNKVGQWAIKAEKVNIIISHQGGECW